MMFLRKAVRRFSASCSELASAPLRGRPDPSRAVPQHDAGRSARRPVFASAPRWAVAVAAGTGLLVLAPLASLLATALAPSGRRLARQLVADVLPSALVETALLLGGVALVAGAVGTGAAWLVSAHDFPVRRLLAWLLPLPLAVPTYLTAYVYVDLLDAAGPVQSALRSLMGWRLRGEYWFPEVRSLLGCVLVMSFVLYPYVYITARAMFLTQSAAMLEVARTLGASRWELFRNVAVPLARPALAVGLSPGAPRSPQRHRRQPNISASAPSPSSIFTTWLNRGSLPAAAQIACAMLAVVAALIVLERRGRQNRRYAGSARRARVARPVPPRAAARDPGRGGLRAARAARLRRSGGVPRQRGRGARSRRAAGPHLPAPSGDEPSRWPAAPRLRR